MTRQPIHSLALAGLFYSIEPVRKMAMAARTNKPRHEEKTKRLIQASQLLNRLISHANGKLEMTQSQVNAARIVIGKSIPDLKAIEHTGEMTHNHKVIASPLDEKL